MDGQRETKTFTYPNAVVRVHFADLSDDERNRRMKQIRKAAEDVLREKIKNERR